MWVGGNTDTFSEKKFRSRVRLVSLFFAAGYTVVVLRLFQLQVVRGNDLANISEANRTQVIFLRSPRGAFFDRHGKEIVANRPSWSLMYSVPEKNTVSREKVEERIKPFLVDAPGYWTKRLQKAFESKKMVRLVEDVPNKVAFLMREMEPLLPGIRVMMEFRRGYPEGPVANHLIGYLGEITEGELKVPAYAQRKLGDLIGKVGLERSQDEKLRGQDGGIIIEVDSIGKLKRVIKELPFQKGTAYHLTLDVGMQRVAEKALAESSSKRGAAVAIDVDTGDILVWASAPGFDPSDISDEDLKDPKKPFLDRVYKGTYPPASTFKIITAIAGFEKNLVNTYDRVHCRGFVALTDKQGKERRYRCWTTHGMVDYWAAMAQSCDTYFYELGRKVGAQAISDVAEQFGYGQGVLPNTPGESKGLIPSPIWERKTGRGGWSVGDTFNMSIGQGYLLSTPLQQATLIMAIANSGLMYRPHIIQKTVDQYGVVTEFASKQEWKKVVLKENTWQRIHQSLGNVVSWGTGAATKIEHLEVRGKTGTAQNPHGEDHAWFVGYAGYKNEKPKVAICVFVENGGHGGSVAAPIVRQVLEKALPPKTGVPSA